MQLNIRKLDKRIEKLKEIRRIAADPEMVALLLEFIGADDERTETPAPAADPQPAAARPVDDMDIVSQVVNGMGAQGGSGRQSKRQ